MNYKQLESEVISAYRQQDYSLCFSLLDDFIEQAEALDLGEALCLKASVIVIADPRRAPEGLSLTEEALLYMSGNPDKEMSLLVTALGLCFKLGDVEKAKRYELLAHRLLQQYPGNPTVVKREFRLHSNLGLIARLRGEHASAYWHCVQGVNCLLAHGSDDESDVRCWLLNLYINMIDACLDMRRLPEAEDCLLKAKDCVLNGRDLVRWTIAKVRVLQCTDRSLEAGGLLDTLPPLNSTAWSPTLVVQYHLLRALIAQDRGELRRFHHHVVIAQRLAVEHSLDYLVCEVQRVQRMPLTREVAQ